MEDVLRSLGFLCLGSRLKRIGEQLQADTQRVLDRLDVRVQSSQYPLLAALDRLGRCRSASWRSLSASRSRA